MSWLRRNWKKVAILAVILLLIASCVFTILASKFFSENPTGIYLASQIRGIFSTIPLFAIDVRSTFPAALVGGFLIVLIGMLIPLARRTRLSTVGQHFDFKKAFLNIVANIALLIILVVIVSILLVAFLMVSQQIDILEKVSELKWLITLIAFLIALLIGIFSNKSAIKTLGLIFLCFGIVGYLWTTMPKLFERFTGANTISVLVSPQDLPLCTGIFLLLGFVFLVRSWTVR